MGARLDELQGQHRAVMEARGRVVGVEGGAATCVTKRGGGGVWPGRGERAMRGRVHKGEGGNGSGEQGVVGGEHAPYGILSPFRVRPLAFRARHLDRPCHACHGLGTQETHIIPPCDLFGCSRLVRISLVSSHNTSYLTLSLERVLVAGQTDADPMNPPQLIQRSYLALKKHRRGLIISCVSACVQGRGRRQSIMSSRFSSRGRAGHMASTSGKLRDQPRLHRCSHCPYTTLSTFNALASL